ncbi:histamine N-methyltransferase A-like isoform X2 [Hyperolius riggenbachi]|uniref:histamine N-methyltransferase A-like isoform X2 n=1 Tax=Hyperolius riggenbachi TaxID=752182 RepID=UPI0035A2E8DD
MFSENCMSKGSVLKDLKTMDKAECVSRRGSFSRGKPRGGSGTDEVESPQKKRFLLPSAEEENMESGMRSLLSDNSRYVESFRLFLRNSTEHQCMQNFIENKLADIVCSIGNGKTAIDVLGVGSGSGEIDLQMLSKIYDRYPGVSIHNNIIEPSPEQILSYKERVFKTPGLDHITFHWNRKTSAEFEAQVKAEKPETKYDFIHMIQMLYYVKDVPATLTFFRSLLAAHGKLLIILVSGKSGWTTLKKKYGSRLPLNDLSHYITAGDIADMLQSLGAKHQVYDLQSDMDITECFVDGDRNGELLLDFITETCDFKKTAPTDLRDDIIQELRNSGCSKMRDRRIIFNNNISVIVVESEQA